MLQNPRAAEPSEPDSLPLESSTGPNEVSWDLYKLRAPTGYLGFFDGGV
mgnify:CR=1 FL=1